MAKQCGPIFLECTWDDLTFYKMEGDYYVRKRSKLTREDVLTLKAFALTRFYANLLATASKIASSIYSDLPVHWRRFWMFRSFTGEGQVMLEKGATQQEVYDYLWHTYVEYWVTYQQATGIQLKAGRTAKRAKPKTYKTRIKHRIGEGDNKCRSYRGLLGKNHWKSNYNPMAELKEKERKRKEKERVMQWVESLVAGALAKGTTSIMHPPETSNLQLITCNLHLKAVSPPVPPAAAAEYYK